MTDEISLRDTDRVVLQCIQKGQNDVQKITAETTLENHHVSYSFEKLENYEMVTVNKPDGMVERVIDGQKRVFQAPTEARLTKKGKQFLEEQVDEDLDRYEDMSRKELIERVKQLEEQVDELEQKFEVFQKQVKKSL